MKNDREFTGTLLGFDDFVSKSLSRFQPSSGFHLFIDMVLEDVIE